MADLYINFYVAFCSMKEVGKIVSKYFFSPEYYVSFTKFKIEVLDSDFQDCLKFSQRPCFLKAPPTQNQYVPTGFGHGAFWLEGFHLDFEAVWPNSRIIPFTLNGEAVLQCPEITPSTQK